ncbi:unnamed protein product, partial [Polarella glacialis]
MVGLAAGFLGSSRLLGDDKSRVDCAKPRHLTADQLVASGPQGGPWSPQAKRHNRIRHNQIALVDAAATVVENPRSLHKALGTRDLLDVTSDVFSDVRGRLGQVIMDRVRHAFLETSITSTRHPMRKERLKKLKSEVFWARGFLDRCSSKDQGDIQRIEVSFEALDSIQKAQVLQLEAASVAAAAQPFSPLSGVVRLWGCRLTASSPGKVKLKPGQRLFVTQACIDNNSPEAVGVSGEVLLEQGGKAFSLASLSSPGKEFCSLACTITLDGTRFLVRGKNQTYNRLAGVYNRYNRTDF